MESKHILRAATMSLISMVASCTGCGVTMDVSAPGHDATKLAIEVSLLVGWGIGLLGLLAASAQAHQTHLLRVEQADANHVDDIETDDNSSEEA